MRAYDIEILKQPVDRADPDQVGWCFGLPAGIAPEQWPLDPNNGYPLLHGFTLLLPQEYRCHGPEYVALSFFGTPFDMDDGGPETEESIRAAVAEAREPQDPDLKIFWKNEKLRHPRLSRMKDLLDCNCAVIFLTRAEFDQPLCQPPILSPNLYRDKVKMPRWLQHGAAAAVSRSGHFPEIQDLFGGTPHGGLDYNRALRFQERVTDPNAGKAPRDLFDLEQTDYQHPFFPTESGDIGVHEWANGLGKTHIGGTMTPGQDMPRSSPYYIEFEQHFGGFNFAHGTAELDIKNMTFDVIR